MNPNDPYQQGPYGQPQPTSVPPQPQTVQPQMPTQSVPQQNQTGQFNVVPTPLPGAGGGVNGGHNPYEFIMTSNQQPKKSLFSFAGGSGNNPFKLLIIVGGITLIIVVLGLIATAFIPSGAPEDQLRSIAQRQEELVRVAQLGERNANDESAKALAYNIDFSLNSNQAALTSAMDSRGISISTEDLALKEDADTDKTLDDAKANNTYDSTFTQLMDDQLVAYLSEVQSAYRATTNPEIKATLQDLYDDGVALYKQAGGEIDA